MIKHMPWDLLAGLFETPVKPLDDSQYPQNLGTRTEGLNLEKVKSFQPRMFSNKTYAYNGWKHVFKPGHLMWI